MLLLLLLLSPSCTPGPKERLDDTSIAQPCLFVANLAALEVLRGQDPTVVEG